MNHRLFSVIFTVLLLDGTTSFAQQVKFNHIIDGKTKYFGPINAIAQDRLGYIWFGVGLAAGGHGGVYKYDGSNITALMHDQLNANSLAYNWAECMIIDLSGIIWIGTYGGGLNSYDPSTNSFKHFKHDPDNNYSLANDTVTALLQDSKGNLWVGTYGGLDLMDRKSGRFRHYANKPGDTTSLSYNHVRTLYEDRQGTLWIGSGSPFFDVEETPEDGGLNRYNSSDETFTRYLHDTSDPNSIATNKISALLEDSRGNFWVGTSGDGLHIMDRIKGTFTHYYFDPAHPEKLSRPPLYKKNSISPILFIKEDVSGAIWISAWQQGINRYDPVSKKITHYGLIVKGDASVSSKDTATGFNDNMAWTAFTSKDGLFWITTLKGNLYNINPLKTQIPYYIETAAVNSFYKQPHKNILWTATNKGLIRKDIISGAKNLWRREPLNKNSLCSDTINALRVDGEEKFWMATANGLSKFDPLTNTFTTYRHIKNDTNSLSSNYLNCLFIANNKNIWIGTQFTGLDKLDTKTNKFSHFEVFSNYNGFGINYINCINEDKSNTLWIGTGNGITSLDSTGRHFKWYLVGSSVTTICVSRKDKVWAGTNNGLFYLDKIADNFLPYSNLAPQVSLRNVLHILEDSKHNFWVTTSNALLKMNVQQNEVILYGANYGIHQNALEFADNFESWDGELFFGDQTGYYAFYPAKMKANSFPPIINFTRFKVKGKEVQPVSDGILRQSIWNTKEIKLGYNQNIFSFDFDATYYDNPEGLSYSYMLENYDYSWRSLGADHTTYFFNVPPGTYLLHVKAVTTDGLASEKTMGLTISPPWWQTWWAYSLYILIIGASIWAFIRYRSKALRKENLLLEEKVNHRTTELQQSLQELKSTQQQLIQQEKMASLGELTAGIAHEIQNPLNFVNNFSEVNKELIEELQAERLKPNEERDEQLQDEMLNDIKDNEEKINQHGKRADAIVKGMLQHSRTSNGQKEPTDINALCDEYLRLSYHGLRAKDKSFNAIIKTEFDERIGKINIIPQDIGRVILNLLNNAFYAVSEKQKQNIPGYEPVVTIRTSKEYHSGGWGIQIGVTDNGNGIPKKILDKIFQPFFTTKPTGQGTGLGLSLSYDIVKAHGGEIKVETGEGAGTTFIIQLPAV